MIGRPSGTFFDKVALFLTVVTNFLCTVGSNMTILLAAEALDLAHILTLPSPVDCIGNMIRVGDLLECSLCEKMLLLAKQLSKTNIQRW
jgi:hypothetical protein